MSQKWGMFPLLAHHLEGVGVTVGDIACLWLPRSGRKARGGTFAIRMLTLEIKSPQLRGTHMGKN